MGIEFFKAQEIQKMQYVSTVLKCEDEQEDGRA